MNCQFCNQPCLNNQNNVCSKCSTSGQEYNNMENERGNADKALDEIVRIEYKHFERPQNIDNFNWNKHFETIGFNECLEKVLFIIKKYQPK